VDEGGGPVQARLISGGLQSITRRPIYRRAIAFTIAIQRAVAVLAMQARCIDDRNSHSGMRAALIRYFSCTGIAVPGARRRRLGER